MNRLDKFTRAFEQLPLIAILRGLQPDNAVEVANVLVECGFGIIEVPLNSPEPFVSIDAIASEFPEICVGSGTVLSAQDVSDTANAGGQLIVAPNFNPAVALASAKQNLVYLPGVATPSEAFAALEAGAHGLKLFPADLIPPPAVKAMRAVLPRKALLLPVGGITPANLHQYLKAGVNGFGLGSALFKPGNSIEQIARSAGLFKEAIKNNPET